MKEYTTYKLRLKPAILEEAQKCFAHSGIRAVKMDDIAKHLGISKRTVYELYATKEDLVCEVVAKWHAERDKRIQSVVASCASTMDVLIEVLNMQLEIAANINFSFFQDIYKYPKVANAINEYGERQNAYAAQFFAQGVKEGFFREEVNYAVFNRIVSGTMEMLCADNRFDDLTYKELFFGYLYVMIRGFCTSKGMKKIDKFADTHFSD